MPAAVVNGIDLYYEVHGNGEPLVLIIGHGTNTTRWFRQVPILSKEYRVIAFDNRGAGRSSAPDIPYTMQMLAGDVAGLLDCLGIRTAHIYGTALGSAIAQEFALTYPDRVCDLVLGAAWCGGQHTVWQNEFTPPAPVSPPATTGERARPGLQRFFSQGFIDTNPELIKQHQALAAMYPAPAHGVSRQSEAVRGFDSWERLPGLKTPVLVIHGSEDRIIPVENGRMVASRIPGSRLVILEGKGHGYYIEAADEVNRIVLEFMKKHRCRR